METRRLSSWTRRDFLSSSALALAAASVRHLPAFGQQQPVQTAFTPLRGEVGIFTGQGGTIGWLVNKDAVAVVDTQFPATAQVCLEGLNERSGKHPIDCLVNSHHHGDHTAGNGVFRAAAKKIVAHARVPELQRAAAARANSPNQPVVADTTFADSWRADLGGEILSLKHYGPAHTGGDCAITFERANVVHMGDLMFNRRHPVIDRPGGASVAGWISVLEAIAADHDGDTLYIFGHAGASFPVTGGRADLMYQRDYFTALLEHVREEIKAGRTREQVVKDTSEVKGFPEHGPLTERVLTAVYEELTA